MSTANGPGPASTEDTLLCSDSNDYGGVIFEDDKPNTLAEAMLALEKGLAEYFVREGIE